MSQSQRARKLDIFAVGIDAMTRKSTPQQQQLRLVSRYLRLAGYVNESDILKLGHMVRSWKRDKPGESVGHIGKFSVRLAKRRGVRLEDGNGKVLVGVGAGDFRLLSSQDKFDSLSKKVNKHLLRQTR